MLKKEDLPKVDHEGMNSVHLEEADLINTLLETIEKGEESKKVTSVLEQLIEHMQGHFAYEESMMQNRGFTMFDIHRNDHTRILNQTRMAYMNWRNFKDHNALKDFIEEDFIEWLQLHIRAMDSVCADFLSKQDDSPAIQDTPAV